MNRYILILSSILVLSTCSEEKSENRQYVKIPGAENSLRIVVYNSDAAEVLAAIDAMDMVVGTCEFKKDLVHSSYLEGLPIVGHWKSPNIEAIVELHPDIVIAYDKWPSKEKLENKLDKFGISVRRIPCYRVATILDDVRQLGEITGRKKEAELYMKFIRRYLDLLKTKTGTITLKQSLYFESSDFIALSAGSGADEVIDLVNLRNVAGDLSIPYPKISTEWLMEAKPGHIAKIIYSEDPSEEHFNALVNRPAWDKLEAVMNNNVYLISNKISTGPRSFIGALYLAERCYPAIFSDINANEIHKEYCENFFNKTPDKVFTYDQKKD
ncbi:MAG: ABC transporter substrate-binding protein [Bacteroidetes bacterium]|nr:ABC transporter substrate-binding protein [Bacteroidota bacterium]